MGKAGKGVLKIAEEISLPVDAITQTLAVIGRRGAGKTYLAQMIAEQMLDADGQVVVVDAVGVWWGLRVNADGKTKGKQIFVIGGDNGDVPLVPEAGKRIAQLVVEKSISAVIDVSRFGIGERKRFLADFGEEFFQLKKSKRTPVHLFLEEAQLIVPQRINPDEGRMYSAYEQIVRLGRNYGIGATLITQRPQSVNKEVLSQTECLCVLQITGPQERKALEYWVQEAGADRKLVGELPSLERGEGYVWSPAWLKIYMRVHFSKKQTFDASATPIVGQKVRSASLSAVDVEALKKDMSDVVEQASKDDPFALRKRIAELEKGKSVVIQSPAMGVSQWREYGKERGYWDYFEKQIGQAMNKIFEAERAEYRRALSAASSALHRIAEISMNEDILKKASEALKAPVPSPESRTFIEVPKADVPERVQPERVVDTESGIDNPQQRVLDAVAWMNTIGVEQPAKEIVAFLAGYAHLKSKGFTNPCSSLRSRGLIDYPAGGTIALTDAGRQLANFPTSVGTNEELHARILEKLDNPKKKILMPLLEAYPNAMTNEELCAAAGYAHEKSKGYTNPRSTLRTFGLIDYPVSGQVRANDVLFPA